MTAWIKSLSSSRGRLFCDRLTVLNLSYEDGVVSPWPATVEAPCSID